jgi:2-oxoglutarate ferredoxin oxidoreductase subunit alpha
MGEIKFLQGNEACALGAMRAGLRFFGGYPITPSSEIAEQCARLLPCSGGRFIQMEDEIASIASIIGASLAGSKSMTATSGPGFSLMQEALGYGIMAEIPFVVVNVMRGGPSTGHPTGPSQGDIMQARWGTHGDHPAIALYPESVPETYYEIIRAFNLAERFRQPVIFLMDEILGKMNESVEIKDDISVFERKKIQSRDGRYRPYAMKDDIPLTANYGEGLRFHVTGLFHDETGFPDVSGENIQKNMDRMYRKIETNIEELQKWEESGADNPEILLVSAGTQARSAKMACKELNSRGVSAAVFRPLTVWPFPEKRLSALAARSKKVLVIEMNKGQLADECRKFISDEKLIPVNQLNSEMISPDEIIRRVEGVL